MKPMTAREQLDCLIGALERETAAIRKRDRHLQRDLTRLSMEPSVEKKAWLVPWTQGAQSSCGAIGDDLDKILRIAVRNRAKLKE